jgi:2-oxo-4-hydroxy-4-carboxy-5-ureidoimidazoline decarboxylase
MNSSYNIDQINALSPEAFQEALGGIYEHSPWVAREAYANGPFNSRVELEKRFRDVVDAASQDQRTGILRAHPQLSGQAARRGKLTAESTQEQSRLSLNALTGPDLEYMIDINRRFMDKFGFPGIVAVRLHDSIESVIAELEQRANNNLAEETRDAIGQVHHIARFRLHDLVKESPDPPE